MTPTGDIDLVVRRFQQWAREAGINDSLSRVEVEDLGVPHRPIALPVGRQGVYTFQFQSVWLKAGRPDRRVGLDGRANTTRRRGR